MSITRVAVERRTWFHFILRAAYLPAMLLAFNAVGWWLAARHAPKAAVIGVLVLAIVLSFVAERLLPYERKWNVDRGDSWRDRAHFAVNESLQVGLLFLLPALVGALSIDGVWPNGWPFALQVLVAIVVLDACLTLGHWWSHRWPLLWRFHAVHHSVKRFYGFNGLMKHPLHQLFETALATAPLVIGGCRPMWRRRRSSRSACSCCCSTRTSTTRSDRYVK